MNFMQTMLICTIAVCIQNILFKIMDFHLSFFMLQLLTTLSASAYTKGCILNQHPAETIHVA